MYKRIIALVCCLLLLPCAAVCESAKSAVVALPPDSAALSLDLARYALSFSYTQNMLSDSLTADGLTEVLIGNAQKPASEVSHTCAYTLYRVSALRGDEARALFVVSIRGTYGAEWYANFDFAPAAQDDAAFAENFLFAAEDVLLGVWHAISAEPDALVLVTGYSRGAACANILGALLCELMPPENLYVYTFATPGTVRGDVGEYKNIFNFVSDCDVVPLMPLAAWGYTRIGTDITLEGDKEASLRLRNAVESLHELAPSIDDYYGKRHSLTDAGLSDDGLTVYEVMLMLGGTLENLGADGSAEPPAGDIDELGSLVSEASDFHTLMTLLSRLADTEGGGTVLERHMPASYSALLDKLMEAGNGLR